MSAPKEKMTMPNPTPLSRRTFIGTAAALGGLAMAPIACAGPASAETAPAPTRPQTIPALREWSPGSGAFRLGAASRIILRPADARRLRGTAEVFAADLRALSRHAVRVEVTDRAAHKGDVVLALGAADERIGDEGYVLTVDPASVSIKARAEAGAFYGTRTLLQLLRQDTSIPAGVARDWPRYPERGLMVDTARMHFTYEWLAARIRDMAYLKLNYLHLHFTDDEGWRIESRTGVQSEQFLTKKQVRGLVELGKRYHVTVVPEIDMPGHMGALLAHYPQFQLRDKDGVAAPNRIDYTIPEARKLLRDLIAEYLPLFPARYFHMGTDEFLPDPEYANYPQLERYAKEKYGPQAVAVDGVLGLINEMNAYVRSHGRTLRIWNDNLAPGNTVQVDPDVIVEWWTDMHFPYPSPINPKPPQEVLDQGHAVLNAGFFPTYDYPSGPPVKPSIQWTYENWTVNTFHGPGYRDDQGSGLPFYTVDPAEPRNRGSLVHLWNSGGTWTEADAAASIFPRLRVMAQKTWESTPLVPTWTEFQPIIQNVGSGTG
ncbi:family 20 glycosylhydrolase [Actinomadura fibrosa]|uniref:Family 20 glycosylhydrolase n=1 Tax=Actinomadura fibrosa TaxID=111802 RepID=A0ABW2XK61_9ACTN|nr:family 20 glycosylhydrolase [Actinomadura fibrosa]